MDLATLIGLLIGLGALIGGFLLEGGQGSMLVVKTAAIIVFGGTFGAVIVSFTVDELRQLPTAFKRIFVREEIDYILILDQIVDTADKARRGGLLSLENELAYIENDFFTRGLQLVIDGTDPELTRTMLDMEIEAFEKNEMVAADIFMAAGAYAPTMGIIGTVMGLIHVLSSIAEPDKIAGAVAVAFLAILYGVVSANLLWLPFGSKLRIKAEKKIYLMDLIVEGILSIQAGENPRVIREKLSTFLPPDVRKNLLESGLPIDMGM